VPKIRSPADRVLQAAGDSPLRAAVWEFMRPMLSPTLAELNRDTFVGDNDIRSIVELNAHPAHPTHRAWTSGTTTSTDGRLWSSHAARSRGRAI
jgi:hypothetical protein